MLEFKVEKQKLTRLDVVEPATDSEQYLKAKFTVNDADWNGKTKTAYFRLGESVYKALLNSNNECVVPSEVLVRSESKYARTQGSKFFVSLVGEYSTVRITTDEVLVELNASGYSNASTPNKPTENEYQQIITQFNDAMTGLAGVKNNFANAIKGYISGAVVSTDDVSPVEHNPVVWVHGKNLIPFPYKMQTSTVEGGTFTQQDDGGVLVSGTPTDYSSIAIYDGKPLATKGKVTFSLQGEFENVNGALVLYGELNNVLLEKELWYGTDPYVIDLDSYPVITRWLFHIKRGSNNLKMSGTVYPQLEQGDTATVYEKWVDPSTVTVRRYGKNILDLSVSRSNCNVNAPNYTTITANISNGTRSILYLDYLKPIIQAMDGHYLTFSVGNLATDAGIALQIQYASGGNDTVESYDSKSVTMLINHKGRTVTYVIAYPIWRKTSGTDTTSVIKNLMLEISDTATSFESFKGVKYTPAVDGTVEGITSLTPTTTIITSNKDVFIECEYNRDINKALSSSLDDTDKEELQDQIDELKETGGTVGQDGFSPIVEITETEQGHNVSITDKNGTQTFSVNNGVDGQNGSDTNVTAENIKTALGYTPADQKDVKQFSEEIVDLKVTDYVVTEAEAVIDRVLEAQGTRTFNMPIITDLHNNGGASDVQIKHACQGIKYIADRIKIDAFACLGDHTDNDGQTNWEDTLADIFACNNRKNTVRVDRLEAPGNHDFRSAKSPFTFKTISAYSTNVVWGDRLGGYFYKDYADYKLRIICLNTSETAYAGMSDTQHNWLIESLDLSTKEDASVWQILILSHIPLDWASFSKPVYILKAYLDGTTWTDGTISCDFTGKNQAKIIATVHGHIHNFLVEKLYLSGHTEQINLYRIAIPEVTELYGNHYSEPYKHDTTYSKVANTAKDTSFNVLCIDLDSKKIEAVCYGAGIDRTIKYADLGEDSGGEDSGTYTNLLTELGWDDGYRISTSSGELRALADASAYGMYDLSNLAIGDVLRIYNPNGFPNTAADQFTMAVYKDGTYVMGSYLCKTGHDTIPAVPMFDCDYSETNIAKLTVTAKPTSFNQMRFALQTGGDGSVAIMTLNEEINGKQQ